MSSSERLAMPAQRRSCSVPALNPDGLRQPRSKSAAQLVVAFSAALAWLASSLGAHAQCPTPTGSFSNTTTISSTSTVNSSGANNASPYPSTITVPSTVAGTVTQVQVCLNGIAAAGGGSNTSLEGMEVLLVSPSGAEMEILGGVGSTATNVTGLSILLGDGSGAAPETGNVPASGTVDWEPSAYVTTGQFGLTSTQETAIQFPPTVGDSTLASAFNGQTAAGTWSLYVVDDFGNVESISGWDLYLTTNAATVGTTTSISSSGQPSFTTGLNDSVTFTATVRSNATGTPPGTVTFSANGVTIGGCGAQPLDSSGVATCTTTLTTQGLNSIQATYSGGGGFTASNATLDQLVEVHPTQTSNTWCNPGSITAPDAPSLAMVYPSVIPVSEYAAGDTVGEVSVELNGVTATGGPNDQFLLVAPGGGVHNLDILDQAFTSNSVSNVSFTVSDSGSSPFDVAATNGDTYLPYDGNLNAPNDTWPSTTATSFDANIPQVPSTINRPQGLSGVETYTADTLEQAFSGAPVNGEWALYVYGESPETINGGWCIDFTTINSGTATATAVTSSQQKQTIGQPVTFTATVTSSGNPVASGTVTFVDSTTEATLASGVPLNPEGQAIVTTSTLTEGDHKITATYNGTSSFNTSFGFVWQRLDDATSVAAVNSTTWLYCNAGPVEIPASVSGAYTPNPSNIFVTNFPGTMNSLFVELSNFSLGETQIWNTASLLESPSGAALDFFSNTGGEGTEVATPGIYVFADSSSAEVPDNEVNVSPNAYLPTSYQPTYASADTFISSQSGFYNAPSTFNTAPPKGNSSFASTFPGGSNPNGAWSLFFNQHLPYGQAGAANGWCLQLAENPPSATVLLPDNGTFTAGQPASFTVEVTNNGPGSTGDPTGGSAPLTFTDTLPTGLTYSGFSGTNWSCSATGQAVTCTNDTSIPDGSQYPELTVDVNVSATASGTLVNGPTTVSGAGVASTISNPENITVIAGSTTTAASVTATFNTSSQTVPLTATVTSGAGTVNSGTVTFTVFNSGNTQVGTAVISGTVTNGTASANYTLPGGSDAGTYTIQASYSGATGFSSSSDSTHTLTVDAASTTTTAANQTANFSASNQVVTLSATVTSPAGTVNTGTVTFTLLTSGNVTVGTPATSGAVSGGSASVNYTVPAGTSGTLTIQAVYNGATDFKSSTDTSHTLTISTPPSLSLAKSSMGTFTQGQTGTFILTLSNAANAGPEAGTTTVSDTLPTGYTFASAATTGGFACMGTTAVTCSTTTTLAPGASDVITLTVSVPANSPTSVSNVASWTATLAGPTGATTGLSNSVTVAVTQVPAAISIVSGTNQSATVSTPFTAPLIVLVSDAGGLAIPNASVTFAAPASGPSGTFSNGLTSITTPASSVGQASAAFTANATAGGPYLVTATAGTVTTNPGFSLTNNAPVIVATQIVVSGYPGSVYVGTSHTATATVEDSSGNTVTTYSGSAAITTSDSAATVATPVTITNGVATFPVTFNTTGTQSITATIVGLNSVSQTGIQVSAVPGFVVTTATDDPTGNAANCPPGGGGADCSLRDALAAAASAGEGNITFDPTDFTAPTTITLTGGTLAIPNQTSIQGLTTGTGATLTNLVTVAGSNGNEVFNVGSGVAGAAITNLNLTSNSTNNSNLVENAGSLSITSTSITGSGNNLGTRGIYNDSTGTLNLTSSTVTGNTVVVAGSSNPEAAYGGGIYVAGGTVNILASTIEGNGADAETCGTLQCGENSAHGYGGGIYVGAGTVTITGSTISKNEVSADSVYGELGNYTSYGAGIDIGGGTVTINNSIVSGNNDASDINGTYAGTVNLVGGTVSLASLGNYGGPTQTMLPLPGSTAICGALAANIPSGVTTDQRGDPNTNTTYPGYNSTTPCVDAGAVQTNYAISFTADPPSSGTVPGTAMSPAPAVTIVESGAPFTASSASIGVTDANADLTTTPATASTTGGIATFSTLIFTSATSGDTLTGTLALNPSLTTPLSLTTQSTPFTVGMAAPTVTWPTASAITFGQTLASSTLTGGSATFNNTPVPGTFAFTNPNTAPSAGTQSESVTFTPTNTGEYSPVMNNVSVLVNKAPTSISIAPTASTLTYGQTLASSTLSGGTAISTITNGTVAGTFAFTTPTTVPPSGSSSQGITFTPTDTTDYLATTGSVTVQVNAATINVTWPTASAITFGQMLSSSTLTGGSASFNNAPVAGTFAFTNPSTIPSAGTQSESVTFTPTNTGEYSSVMNNVSVLVNKAPTSISIAPTASTLTYGQTLASSTLSGGTALSTITNSTVAGTFAFTTPTTVPPSGSSSQGITFTPTDTTDYLTTTGLATVQVNAATITVTWPTATAITYGQMLSSSTLTGGSAKSGNTTVPGTFAFTNPNTAPSAGTQSESVTFTPTNTGEYSPVSSNISVPVNKAPTKVTVPPTASAITSGQTLASSTLSGGTAISTITSATVPGVFAFTNPSTAPTSTASQSVTFTPTDTNDYLGTTTSVTVTVNPPPKQPIATISPSNGINFGTLYLGSIVTKTVTITNTGNATMTISDPRIAIVQGGDSDEFITLNFCPRSLAAGKSCTMTVTFIAGPFYNPQTATLMIYDNAAGSPQSVPLTATVIDPVAQFNPNSLNFGTVKAKTGATTKSITLTSIGGTPLSISSVAITGADPGDFSQTNTCSSTTLNPKKTCSITVTFKPAAKGSRSATLRVTDNAWNSPQSIPLSGTGD